MKQLAQANPAPLALLVSWVLILTTGLGLISCGPKIHDFAVWPRRACPDDTVFIRFDVRGDAHVNVVRRGSETVDTTTYMLVVDRNGKTEIARQDVVRWSAPPTKEFVFRTTRWSTDSVHVVESLSDENWKSGLLLSSLASESGRAIRVQHAGREAILDADGSPSMSFEGLPINGTWELSTALLQGEIIGNAEHAPPDRLRLKAVLQCNQKGATP